MSLSSVTALAIKRDETHPSAELQVDNQRATWSKVLVSAIPTEILTVYTASLGVAAGLATADNPQAYLPFRFVWYGAWLLATPLITCLLYLRKTEELRKTKAKANPGMVLLRKPWWKYLMRPEIAAATVSAAAWFTAMPGSPWQVALSGGAFALTSMASTAVGALLVGMIAPRMTSPTPDMPMADGPQPVPGPAAGAQPTPAAGAQPAPTLPTPAAGIAPTGEPEPTPS